VGVGCVCVCGVCVWRVARGRVLGVRVWGWGVEGGSRESIYMTANLEQWGEELEHMLIRVETVSEGTFVDAVMYQMPTTTFPMDTPSSMAVHKLTSIIMSRQVSADVSPCFAIYIGS